ncbi:hypothetical protein DH2020_020157 [Rehmannia glutinosa]|uniref:Uncharacterized protein n=1 Tax=Rehmannia glutinosa TaxID=99300 RepID=A0ABR0WFA4_REHGL
MSANRFSITRGIGSSYNSKGIAENGHNVSRLNSQLSFTRPKEALSRISEETDSVGDGDNGKRRSSNHSNNTACFEMGLWDDQDNPLTFSVKQPKTISTHVVNCPDTMESQFGMPQAALELTPMDKLMHIPQDSVPCKIRAKRGFATHPRSIAERSFDKDNVREYEGT